VTSRDEIEIAAIPQKLKLLAYLWLYVLIVRIETAEPIFKCVDVV